MSWYLKVVQNYVGFQGRARRKEYWFFVLFNWILAIVAGILDRVLHLHSAISVVYSLALLLPSLAVGVRRLHDTGRSGWWLLLSLIPLVGSIIIIVFMCLDSQDAGNKYGQNPKTAN